MKEDCLLNGGREALYLAHQEITKTAHILPIPQKLFFELLCDKRSMENFVIDTEVVAKFHEYLAKTRQWCYDVQSWCFQLLDTDCEEAKTFRVSLDRLTSIFCADDVFGEGYLEYIRLLNTGYALIESSTAIGALSGTVVGHLGYQMLLGDDLEALHLTTGQIGSTAAPPFAKSARQILEQEMGNPFAPGNWISCDFHHECDVSHSVFATYILKRFRMASVLLDKHLLTDGIKAHIDGAALEDNILSRQEFYADYSASLVETLSDSAPISYLALAMMMPTDKPSPRNNVLPYLNSNIQDRIGAMMVDGLMERKGELFRRNITPQFFEVMPLALKKAFL